MGRKQLTGMLTKAAAITAAGLLLAMALRLPRPGVPQALTAPERTLLRIWVTGAPGGATAWLRERLQAFEKQSPGVMTYLRSCSPEELLSPDATLPDVVLFLPGDVTVPEGLLTPLAGDAGLLREELLRCGRWQGRQYALPVCWGAWVLALSGAMDEAPAATPAPTTLLGRPSATAAPATEPPFPLEKVNAAEMPLASPGGAALMSLMLTLPAPQLPKAQQTRADAYDLFRAGRCACAMLTTGQIISLEGLAAAGKQAAFRVLTPREVATDQVWLAGVTKAAGNAEICAQLLDFLTAPQSQRQLTAQGLHTVRDDLSLYASGVPAQVEQAGRSGLACMSAFLPREAAESAAWQALQGMIPLPQALAELL